MLVVCNCFVLTVLIQTKLPYLPTGLGLLVQYMMFLDFLAWVIWYTGTGTS